MGSGGASGGAGRPDPGDGPRTVAEIWRRIADDPPDWPAFLVDAGDRWREVTWREADEAVQEIAAGLLAIGIGAGDRVAILCRTRLEWVLCDIALVSIGAVVVPIYPTSSAADCAHILSDSGARLLICEDAAQHSRVAPARSDLPALERVVGVDPFPGADVALEGVREQGRRHLAEAPGAVAAAQAAIGEDDVLTIVYTSGTTGPPKGCVLTHLNYWAMVDIVRRVPGLVEPGDRVVLHLPLAHVFARLVELIGARLALTIAFCPEATGLAAALRDVGPTIFPSVPRVYEGVYRAIRSRFAAAGGVERRIVDWALRVGRGVSRRRQRGERVGLALRLQRALAERLVLSKVTARLGGRLRVAISGGAPLSAEIAEFLDALGVLVLEGYGLTECTTVAAVNRPDRYRFGTVGPPVPDVDVRIADDGEILLRGDTVFRGYWGDPAATREVLGEDGWLRTGDVGAIDPDGFLVITDRKKDIIVTPSGKNVSPQNIEGALKASEYVSDALVIGDRRPYLSALVTIDRDATASVAGDEEGVRALIDGVVAEVNEGLDRTERVRRVAILPRDFLLEEGEVTPTLKLRREACEAHFRDEIERLYTGPEEGATGRDR